MSLSLQIGYGGRTQDVSVFVVVVVVLVVTAFFYVCYYLSQTFSFLGARTAPREIEEVERTGDIDSVKATGKEIVTTSREKTRLQV